MNMFRIYEHLLPRARAWSLRADKKLREFFQGISEFGPDIKDYYDLIWLDIFPETTRQIPEWEETFGLPNTLTVEQDRRDRLLSAWRAQGGQSPRYIQDTLQAAGFNVFVHEWFEPPAGYPPGEPVLRHPLEYIVDSSGQKLITTMCGVESSVCGNPEAVCGAYIEPEGYLLVNKLFSAAIQYYGSGNEEVNCGHAQAICGRSTGLFFFSPKPYIIPRDAAFWPYFLYIGGETFPDLAEVLESRRNEFETLILKLKPAQQWLGMLIEYVEEIT